MKVAKYIKEDKMVEKAIKALIGELGSIEASRFINMPRKTWQESVKRHRKWQKMLDKNNFFNKVFE